MGVNIFGICRNNRSRTLLSEVILCLLLVFQSMNVTKESLLNLRPSSSFSILYCQYEETFYLKVVLHERTTELDEPTQSRGVFQHNPELDL